MRVSSPVGVITSAVAYAASTGIPNLFASPQAITITNGSTAAFSVAVFGEGTLAYQWQRNGTDVPNATNASLTLTGVTAAQAGNYSVRISNAIGATNSAAATLTVIVPTTIIGQSLNQAVCEGESLTTFQVSATGGGVPTYQWRKDGTNLVEGPNYSSVTSSLLSLMDVTTNMAGGYSVVVTGNGGSVTSNPSLLTVTPMQTLADGVPLPGQGTDLLSPTGRIYYRFTVPPGVARLVVATSGGSGDCDLRVRQGTVPTQFLYHGISATPGTAETVSIDNPTPGVWFISLSAFPVFGDVTLRAAVPVPPTIISPPASATVVPGGTHTFSVSASGTLPLSYQWRFNGNPRTDATNASLTLTNIPGFFAGTYDVVVSNLGGSVTSTPPAVLTVLSPPSITTQPMGQSLNLGGSAVLSVAASGTGLSYQWQFNGMNIAGATSPTLTLTNLSIASAGIYRVLVSNAAGIVTSEAAVLRFFGDLQMYAGMKLTGLFGEQYRIDYAEVLGGVTNWVTLTNLYHPGGVFFYVDPSSAGKPRRFYRAVLFDPGLPP